MRCHRRVLVGLVMSSLALWVTPGAAQSPPPKAQWVVAIGEEGESLDPPTSMHFTSEIYQQHIFDSLVGIQVPGGR